MLDKLIMRAADDENFRKALLSNPDAAIANANFTLSEDERAVLEEYRRVACSMTEQQLASAIRDYASANQGKAAIGL
ncbi:MAG TPA: Os1348 family NHLP clan protein [Myxococcaceae bacterium]